MNKDYAIIFQKFEHEEVEYYLPIDVTEGIYLEKIIHLLPIMLL